MGHSLEKGVAAPAVIEGLDPQHRAPHDLASGAGDCYCGSSHPVAPRPSATARKVGPPPTLRYSARPMALGAQTARAKTEAEERSFRAAVFIIFALTLLRILWIASGTTDLYPDEAQYWLWSLKPDWGYYSKPPLIAWLIAGSTWLAGSDN